MHTPILRRPSQLLPLAGGLLLLALLAACADEAPVPGTTPSSGTDTAFSPAAPAASGTPPSPDYVQRLQAWRNARIQRLKAPDGWLSLAGLFWLKEGANTFGADPGQDLVVPVKAAPPRIGTFTRTGTGCASPPRWAPTSGRPARRCARSCARATRRGRPPS